jgi:hypothetical protein
MTNRPKKFKFFTRGRLQCFRNPKWLLTFVIKLKLITISGSHQEWEGARYSAMESTALMLKYDETLTSLRPDISELKNETEHVIRLI